MTKYHIGLKLDYLSGKNGHSAVPVRGKPIDKDHTGDQLPRGQYHPNWAVFLLSA